MLAKSNSGVKESLRDDGAHGANEPHLSPVPGEVLALILEQVPHGSSLINCLTVNSFFHDVTEKILYRSIRITYRGNPLDVMPILPTNMTKRDTYVRKVNIMGHYDLDMPYRFGTDCPLPPLPYLDTMRVFWYPSMRLRDRPLQLCSAVRTLKPKNLVIRNASIITARSVLDNQSNKGAEKLFSCTILDSVERYVCVVDPDAPSLDRPNNAFAEDLAGGIRWLASVPSHPRSVTIIFRTPDPAARWPSQPNPVNLVAPDPTVSGWLWVVFRSLADWVAAAKGTSRIKFVNAGAVRRSPNDMAEVQRMCEDIVRSRLLEIEADDADAKGRQSAVEFLTMREYLSTEDWTGVFDPEEVAAWMRPDSPL